MESDLDQLGIMAHRFARSARLLAFSPARAAAAAALPAALLAKQAKAEANNDKETVAAAAAAAAVGYAAVAATQANAKAKDAQERLKALEVRAAKATSAAFVFVKPHAVTDSVKTKVKAGLEKAGISVLEEGSIAGPKIDADMLIDTHYGAIAAKAVKLKPSELKPSAKALKDFEAAFGLTWADALKQGLVYNAADACKQLGCDGAGLDAKWSTLTRGQNLIKFGGGFYCGKVEGIYVMNGFYMAMRGKFTDPSATIHYYLVEWPTSQLSWADFRGKVLGATDPSEAASGSLRRAILDDWRALGLPACPDTGDNGVHASASPFEALSERVNWCGASFETDPYGRGLVAAGVDASTLKAWAEDPQVKLPGGGAGSLFDALEDLDADKCLETAQAIKKANE